MNKFAHVSGIFYATLFGFSFMFSKIALGIVSEMGLIAYRFIIAAIAFELLRRLKLIQVRFDKEFLKAILPVILFQPILYFVFETTGLSRTSSSEAGMMIAMIPIVVGIFSAVFLKERPNLFQVFFIVLSILGVAFINFMKINTGVQVQYIGLLLLFGAVLSAAFYGIFARRATKIMTASEVTYYMMISGAIFFNLLYIGLLLSNGEASNYISLLGNRTLWIPLLYLGIGASIGGFFFMNYSFSHLEAHVVSIYANGATLVSILAGAFLLHETLYYYHYIGSAMILIGVYGTVRFATKAEEEIINDKPF